MPAKKNGLRTIIIRAIVGVAVASMIPGTVWIHNSYADNRYVQQTESLRQQIQQIDNALFEIDQEILFATNGQDKAKWTARKQYYERQKAALLEQLKAKS